MVAEGLGIGFGGIGNIERGAARTSSTVPFRDVSVDVDGTLARGMGGFCGPGHAEAAGKFERSNVAGAFGAKRRSSPRTGIRGRAPTARIGETRAISGGGVRELRGNPVAWLVLALLPVLSGCGAAAAAGSALYSTTEAIATAVKDAMKQPDGGTVEDHEGGPDHGQR